MKKSAILIAALFGLAVAACNKSAPENAADQTPATPTPKPTPTEAQMRQAYGFAAEMPADTAYYGDFYNFGKLISDFKASKTWASIKTNPILGPKLKEQATAMAMMSFSNPDAANLKNILKDAFGSEAFIAFSPGSETNLHSWVELNSSFRIARLQAILAGGMEAANDPKLYATTIIPKLKDLDFPPMIIGFKITTQKVALDAEIAKLEAGAPPMIEKASFQVDGQPFKSLAITAGKALDDRQKEALKSTLQGFVEDPLAAQAAYESILARRLEVAYGYKDGYFIISIGPDHSHLKFAENYAGSLLSRPEMKKAADYADKPLVSLGWASQQFLEASRQDFALSPVFESMMGSFTNTNNAADIAKLDVQLKQIDTEGQPLFHPPMTAIMGVQFRDHGLRGEIYGGIDYGAPAAPMKFTGVPGDDTFLWMDRIANPALCEKLCTWLEDVSSTGYNAYKQFVVAGMPPSEQKSFEQFDTYFKPAIAGFYKITRDEFAKGVGLENAIAMDLKGEMPDFPIVPKDFQGGKIFRLAYLSQVRERPQLSKSWDDYFKIASDLSLKYQSEKFPTGLTVPVNENVDGVSLSFYKLVKADFLPNVAITDKTFVASTSRAYSLELTKAAAAGTDKPLLMDFRMNTKPVFDLAQQWLTMVMQNPEAFFSDDEEKADEFKKNEPGIAALLQSLRAFQGITVQAYQEDGAPRISSHIRWEDK